VYPIPKEERRRKIRGRLQFKISTRQLLLNFLLLGGLLALALGGTGVATRVAHRLGSRLSSGCRALVTLLELARRGTCVTILLLLGVPVLLRLRLGGIAGYVRLLPLGLALLGFYRLLRSLVETVLELSSDMGVTGLLALAVRLDVDLGNGGARALLLLASHLHSDLVGPAGVGGLLAVEVVGAFGGDSLLGVSGSGGDTDLASLLGTVNEVLGFLALTFGEIGLELADSSFEVIDELVESGIEVFLVLDFTSSEGILVLLKSTLVKRESQSGGSEGDDSGGSGELHDAKVWFEKSSRRGEDG
jgi:hypothetical protein